MNTKILALALVAAGLVSGTALAGSSTNTLNVTASVTGKCKFNSAGPSTLAFGAIDPSSASAATATTNILYRCTKGTTSSVTTDNGLNYSAPNMRMKDAGVNFLVYSTALVGGAQVGTGHGAGNDLTLTVNGTVAVTDFQNAAAASYTDTIVLTIAP